MRECLVAWGLVDVFPNTLLDAEFYTALFDAKILDNQGIKQYSSSTFLSWYSLVEDPSRRNTV